MITRGTPTYGNHQDAGNQPIPCSRLLLALLGGEAYSGLPRQELRTARMVGSCWLHLVMGIHLTGAKVVNPISSAIPKWIQMVGWFVNVCWWVCHITPVSLIPTYQHGLGHIGVGNLCRYKFLMPNCTILIEVNSHSNSYFFEVSNQIQWNPYFQRPKFP